MEYLKDHYTVDWDKVHAAHNKRMEPLRAAFKVIVTHDIETGAIPKPEV